MMSFAPTSGGMTPRRWRLTVLATALLLVFTAVGVSNAPQVFAAPSDAKARNQLVKKLNALRKANGLKPLIVSPALRSVAQKWSGTQLSRGTLEHNPRVGSQVPSGWQRWGENVGWARGYSSNTDVIHQGWVSSPGHYDNMVHPDFTHVGIGVASSASGGTYATQVFATYPSSARPRITKLKRSTLKGTGWRKVVVHGKKLNRVNKAKVGKLRVRVVKPANKKVVLRVKVTAKAKKRLQVKLRAPLGWTDTSKKTVLRIRK
ncbi:Uncharacterized conserved protein YkwD, contains CAP (CSP/antigen 5/PR1) domain [Micrococcales bacterium KH10]|nr:Uncharacterized conserved protein YkwD, contains CAP (CSP/antigen 5/PR1) domain [Micrococcales bacterium KH10]